MLEQARPGQSVRVEDPSKDLPKLPQWEGLEARSGKHGAVEKNVLRCLGGFSHARGVHRDWAAGSEHNVRAPCPLSQGRWLLSTSLSGSVHATLCNQQRPEHHAWQHVCHGPEQRTNAVSRVIPKLS